MAGASAPADIAGRPAITPAVKSEHAQTPWSRMAPLPLEFFANYRNGKHC
jgi:hypothetical protein